MSLAPGTPRKITDEQIEEVLVATLKITQGCNALVDAVAGPGAGHEPDRGQPDLAAFGLKPHLVDTFKLSSDPSQHRPGQGRGRHRGDPH